MHKTAIPNGIFLGLAMIICAYVLYVVNPHTYYQTKSGLLLAIIFLIFLKTGREAKNANGHFLSFSKGFKNMFLTGTIGVFMCTLFEYLLINYFAPDLAEIKKEMELESIELMRENFDSAFLNKMMDVNVEQIENGNTNSIGRYIQEFIVRLFTPVAFVAAIISLIIKRSRPSDGDLLETELTDSGKIINKEGEE